MTLPVLEQALRAAQGKPPREALLAVEETFRAGPDGQWSYRELAEIIRRARVDYEKDFTLTRLFRDIEGAPPLGEIQE